MITSKAFKIGDRVQLHPATNLWMRGDRYGTIIKIGRLLVHLKMDKSGRTVRIHPEGIAEVING